MKKLIFSFILGIGFGAFGYAAHEPLNNPFPQKEDQRKVKKTEQYDFTLFKFVAPKLIEKKDTLKKQLLKPNNYKEKGSTTLNHEKPLTFFKLS